MPETMTPDPWRHVRHALAALALLLASPDAHGAEARPPLRDILAGPEILKEEQGGGVLIALPAGTFEVTAPVDLEPMLQALPPDAPVTLRGAPGGSTRISGGKLYAARHPRAGEELPPHVAAAPQLLVIDMDADLHALWTGAGAALPRAAAAGTAP